GARKLRVRHLGLGGDDHVGPVARGAQRDGQAGAAGGAGDEEGLVGESVHGVSIGWVGEVTCRACRSRASGAWSPATCLAAGRWPAPLTASAPALRCPPTSAAAGSRSGTPACRCGTRRRAPRNCAAERDAPPG